MASVPPFWSKSGGTYKSAVATSFLHASYRHGHKGRAWMPPVEASTPGHGSQQPGRGSQHTWACRGAGIQTGQPVSRTRSGERDQALILGCSACWGKRALEEGFLELKDGRSVLGPSAQEQVTGRSVQSSEAKGSPSGCLSLALPRPLSLTSR